MMKTNVKKMMALAIAAITLTACMDHSMDQVEEVQNPEIQKESTEEIAKNIANSFDFKMTTEVPVTLNYGIKGALVEVYDADSTQLAVASSSVRPTKIYSAFTGADGKFSGKMTIPTALIGKTVYAFTKGVGYNSKVAATVTANGLVVNANAKARTRYAIPQQRQLLADGLIDAIDAVLTEGQNHDNLLQNTDINIHVNKDIDYLDVTFVYGGAGVGHWTGFWGSPNDADDVWKCQNGESEPAWVENNYNCSLYYFYYTDKLPTAAEIKEKFINNEHLIFFGANQNTSEALAGNTYRLQVNGSEKIPAGTNIGWIIVHPDYELAYKWPAVGDRASFEQFKTAFDVETSYTNYADFAANWQMPYIYSVNSLNPDGQNQSIRYSYGSGDNEIIVYGMEDLSVTRGNFIWGEEWSEHEEHIAQQHKAQYPFFRMASDRDYNDVMFFVKASDPSAIHDEEIRDIEEEKPEPVYSTESYEGTLLYEDLYPTAGDYDMNDVVITYRLTKYFDQDNKIMKLGYEFTPVWSGASYHSSFSFLMDGLTDVVTVFDDQSKYVTPYKETARLTTFTGTIQSGDIIGKAKDAVAWDTFNPFITVKNTGYEVHLPKKAASPNAKLDGLDEYALHYILNTADRKEAGGEFPYAMNIPSTNYVIVTERVRIDEEYPKFIQWVTSKGSQAADWYIK